MAGAGRALQSSDAGFHPLNRRSMVAPGGSANHCENNSPRLARTRTRSSSVSLRGAGRPEDAAWIAAKSLNSSAVKSVPLARSVSSEPTICSTSTASPGNAPRVPFPVVSPRSQPSATSLKKPRKPRVDSTAKCVRSCKAKKGASRLPCFCQVMEPSARTQRSTPLPSGRLVI